MLFAGVAVMIASMVVPGFKVRGGFGSALLVGLVYGVLKVPLLILAFFAVNAFLLWLTDKLLDDFELEVFSSLLLGTLALSVIDLLLFGGLAFF